MKRLPLILVLLAVLLTAAAPTLAGTGRGVAISPNNPHVVYVGRFTKEYRFGWTGSAIRLRFKGTSVSAKLHLTSNQPAAMQVVIDGKPTRFLLVTKKKTTYVLASGLESSSHTVELFKRSEGYLGEARFDGFILSPGATVEQLTPRTRKILIVGDSITCGFGNRATDNHPANSVTLENGYMAYAPIAARRLDARLMMVCWSGKGMYRNYNARNSRKNTMPQLFARTLPMHARPKWNEETYVPDLIIINLGTNDMNRNGYKKPLTADEFLPVYEKFVARLHQHFPKAPVIAAIGPMVTTPISTWLEKLPQKFGFVRTLVFPHLHGKAEHGGAGHPSVKGDIKMADQLTAFIRKTMHWTG